MPINTTIVLGVNPILFIEFDFKKDANLKGKVQFEYSIAVHQKL